MQESAILIKCICCGQTFQAPSAGWWLCPTCRAQNYVPYPAEKNRNTAATVIICVCAGILFLILISGIVCIALFDTPEDTCSTNYYNTESGVSSLKSMIVRDYIESLPAGQRDAILSGHGSSEDTANAMANLIKSGNLEGAAEYIKGL